MATQVDELRRLTPEEFRDVIGHFASGVTVITAAHDGEHKGTTASAVSSLSLEPPMVLICLNKTSSTAIAVAAAGRFAVNILGEDQAEEAMRFAKPARTGDKFAGVAVDTGEHGEPLLADALATLECNVAEQVTGGTHLVFLAEVERASARTGAPLAYFRGQFGRLELAQDESAFTDIRARVLSRELEVGQPLGLDQLATRLGLLRGPVYHALTRLTGEGLVNRDAQGAFIVTPLTLEAVRGGLAGALCDRARRRRIGGRRRSTTTGSPGCAGSRTRRGRRPPDEFRMDGWLPELQRFPRGDGGPGRQRAAARRVPPRQRARDDPQPDAAADGGARARPRAGADRPRAHRRARRRVRSCGPRRREPGDPAPRRVRKRSRRALHGRAGRDDLARPRWVRRSTRAQPARPRSHPRAAGHGRRRRTA